MSFFDTKDSYKYKEILNPENVPLTFIVAERSTRIAAFYIDFAILCVGYLVPLLLIIFLPIDPRNFNRYIILFLLFYFIVHIGYFFYFEIRWHGSTPGKKLMRLQVIRSDGDPLKTTDIVIRNLMREIEIFIPLGIFAFELQFSFNLLAFSTFCWASIFALIPFIRKDGLRLGDLLAGTMVIMLPKTSLKDDLSASDSVDQSQKEKPSEESKEYKFRDNQMVYGNYELHTLEDILRKEDSYEVASIKELVANRIKQKIKWEGEIDNPDAFLKAFYTAQRAYLEEKLLYGEKKKDKYDTEED